MRRLSSWSIAGIIAGALLLMVGGIGLLIHLEANRAWAAMEERTRALIVEARARPTARPVLRGTAEPGNAWNDYEAASLLLEKLNWRHLQVFVANDRTDNRVRTEEHVAAFDDAIDLFRRGVGRAEVAWPYDGNREPARSYELGILALARAKILREGGRHADAAGLVLDVVQFCGDVRRRAGISAGIETLGLLEMALNQLETLLASWPARGPELAGVERELETLDRSWVEFATTLRNETLAVQSALLVRETPPLLEAWRYGFTGRLMLADAGGAVARYREISLRQESRPWPEQVTEWRAQWRAFGQGPNPLIKNLLTADPLFSETVRERRTQLRLIRMAVHYRVSGEFEPLEDPFGTLMRHSVIGDSLIVWSAGRDGIYQASAGAALTDERGDDITVKFAK